MGASAPSTPDGEPNYWVLEAGAPLATNPAWVGLASEKDGGVIAVGREDVIEACVEALNARPYDWEGPVMEAPKQIDRVTWVVDASIQYAASERGAGEKVGAPHEYDDLLHVFVSYKDGTTHEWSSDFEGKSPDQEASDAVEWATGGQ